MVNNKCKYEDIDLTFETTQIAKAGKKYDPKTNKFKNTPQNYYIRSMGKQGKMVAYSNDYQNVEGFSDKVEVLRPTWDECKKEGLKKAEKIVKGMGLTKNTDYDIRNVEGTKSVVILPNSRVAKYEESFNSRLNNLKKKKIIKDHSCFFKNSDVQCYLD